jgi:cytochrome c oxidase subunit II
MVVLMRTSIPVAALATLLLGAAALASGHQTSPRPTRVVHVVAERFQFTPSEITVDEGTLVELRLTSEDTSHGFRLLGPGGINVEIPKRGRGDIRVMFDALEAGSYTFECSRVCGAGHDFMRGTLRVRQAGADESKSGKQDR